MLSMCLRTNHDMVGSSAAQQESESTQVNAINNIIVNNII